MKTIDQGLKQYTEKIFEVVGISEQVKKEDYDLILETILLVVGDELISKKFKGEEAEVFKKKIEESMKDKEAIDGLIKELADEKELGEVMIEKTNELLARFIRKLNEEGDVKDEQMDKLKAFLEDPKNAEEMQKNIFSKD